MVMVNKFLGFGVDIFSTDLNGKNLPYEMYVYEFYANGLTLPVRDWCMSEDDMEIVTGMKIEELNGLSDIEIAKIIAENSNPYGIVGSDSEHPFVCEFYSSGINHYSDVKPCEL